MNDKYWGFLKTDGAIIVKRWFGNNKEVANHKNFTDVVKVIDPFSAKNMKEAVYYATTKVGAYRKG